jgi:tRNA modification GTPase
MKPASHNPPLLAQLETPPGKGGIAVISLCGHRATQTAGAVFRRRGADKTAAGGNLPADGHLALGELFDGEELIDEAILCRRGNSVEINIHGGPLVVRRTLELLERLGATVVTDAPPQLPASHPRWHNPAVGAELLTHLPKARGRRVVAALAAQWSGGLSKLARQTLNELADAPPQPHASAQLRAAASNLPAMLGLLDPPQVALAGPPNAGKSTLMNRLVGRDVSIVSDRPGTTRDWVRELAMIEGLPVWLIDTAGLWPRAQGLDAEAVARARAAAEGADLVVLLEAGSEKPDWLSHARVLRAWPRADQHPPPAGWDTLSISAVSGAGLDALAAQIVEALGFSALARGDAATLTAAFTDRQARLLALAADAIEAGNTPLAREKLQSLLDGGT